MVGCGKGKYDLEKSMGEMSAYISKNGNIIDVDSAVLSEFLKTFNALDGTKVKVSGLVADFGESFLIDNANIIIIFTDGVYVKAYMEDGESAKIGEYVEVCGNVSTAYGGEDNAYFSIQSGEIIERGNSVKETVNNK